MARTISNRDDVIDSRDVIERIEELKDERDTAALAEELTAWDEENGEELAVLLALEEEAEGYAADWKYGEALIRDSHFREYAQQLAEDNGEVRDDATWPHNCIDWDEAARQLQQDYTEVDFGGVAYWVK